jgi:hypothetical protein
MNTRHAAVLGLVLTLISGRCLAIGCDVREYAQYKDQARTASGQMAMADEYCRFEIRRKAASDLGALALQYRQMRDLATASADEKSCNTEMQKIRDALDAGKATKAWERMTNCGK